MSRLRKPRLSYANVVSTMALFIALGGGAYAAIELPKNSVTEREIAAGAVGNSELARNAVTGSKVKNGSIKAVDLASDARSSGLPSVAAKGATLTGAYGVSGSAGNSGDTAGSAISFPVKLADGAKVAFIGKGQPAIAQCPGDVFSPAATEGVLCVYEGDTGNRRTFLPEFAANGYGAYLRIVAQSSGFFYSQGTWALVAP